MKNGQISIVNFGRQCGILHGIGLKVNYYRKGSFRHWIIWGMLKKMISVIASRAIR